MVQKAAIRIASNSSSPTKRASEAPTVQCRALAVGADGQDRRRCFLLRGALDQRAVDPRARVAGEDKIGFSSLPRQATAAVRMPSFAALILAPAAVPAGLRRICSIKATAARRDVDNRTTGDIKNSQADKDGVKGCHESSA